MPKLITDAMLSEIIRVMTWMHLTLESHSYPANVNHEEMAVELMNVDNLIKKLEESDASLEKDCS